MLTRAKRDQYVAAMKSGNYKFGQGRLFNPRTGCHCGLGVIATEEGMEFDPTGYNIVENGEVADYKPLIRILGPELTSSIWNINDISTDYNRVIELIENQPVID